MTSHAPSGMSVQDGGRTPPLPHQQTRICSRGNARQANPEGSTSTQELAHRGKGLEVVAKEALAEERLCPSGLPLPNSDVRRSVNRESSL